MQRTQASHGGEQAAAATDIMGITDRVSALVRAVDKGEDNLPSEALLRRAAFHHTTDGVKQQYHE